MAVDERPAKRRKANTTPDEPMNEATARGMRELVLNALTKGDARAACAPAWSSNNVLAWAAQPAGPDAPPSIVLTHLSSLPTAKAAKPLAVTLTLPAHPASSTNEALTTLSFSPDGCYLLAATSEARLAVFEQAECIDDWKLLWTESIAELGAGDSGARIVGGNVLAHRWLGDRREWYPAPEPRPATPDDPDADIVMPPIARAPSRPLKCGPLRSQPVVGCAIVLVLASAEVVYLHFPRNSNPSPLVGSVSLTTPSVTVAAPVDSGIASVESLLATLADGATPPIVPPGAQGTSAMQEELRAAAAQEDGAAKVSNRSLSLAAIGATPVSDYTDTHLLVAAQPSAIFRPASLLLFASLTLSSTQSGLRLSLAVLPSIPSLDPSSTAVAPGSVNQLLFSEGPETRTSLVAAFETGALAAWEMERAEDTLDEAFSGLECRKADAAAGPTTWMAKRVTDSTPRHSEFISFLLPGCENGTFLAGHHSIGIETEAASLVVHSLDTLQPLSSQSVLALPVGAVNAAAALSPSRTFICTGPRIALFPVPITESGRMEDGLGQQLAVSMIKQLDATDIVRRIEGSRDADTILEALEAARDTLLGMLKPTQILASSPLQLELLGCASSLLFSQPGLKLRSELAQIILELAACAKAFQKGERKERVAPDVGYRCESDSVWPLIGHVSWYADLCRSIVLDCKNAGGVPHPSQILLLHPLPRSYLLGIVDNLLGLQTFLGEFPPTTNLTVDVSRSVLDDIVEFNGLQFSEWRATLLNIGGLAGLSGDTPELREMLLKLLIPPSFSTSTPLVTALLSSPSLLTPTATPSPSMARDIIRRGELSRTGVFRRCTRCKSKTEHRLGEGAETGRWNSWEMSWEASTVSGILDSAAHAIRQSGKGSGGKKGLKAHTHHFFYAFVWLCGLLAPPVAVLVRFGLGRDFFINVLCTICGYFPGHFHNFYCQTIRNNKNAARTPKWAVKYGLVQVADKRGGKHQWAGRYDERLPDSSRRGYAEGDDESSLGEGAAAWDGRGPEPASSSRRKNGGGDDDHHHFSLWNRTVDSSQVEGGPAPPPDDDYGASSSNGRGTFDPIDNEQFYASPAADSGPQRQSSLGTGGRKKKGLKGILSHRDRYERSSSSQAEPAETDRFERMKAARGGRHGSNDDFTESRSREPEYQDEFERELNEGPRRSVKPQGTGSSSAGRAQANFDSFDSEGPEDAWASSPSIMPQRTGNTSTTASRQQRQTTGSSYRTANGGSSYDAPQPLQQTKTGGYVQGSKEDEDLFNHTF